MLLIPVLEIKDGKCTTATMVRSGANNLPLDNPIAAARHWADLGVRRLHVVDVDSLETSKPTHAGIIREIVNACPDVPLQVSGNMRSDANVEAYFNAGVEYVILGTKTASKPHFINDLCLEYPGHILVELDTRDGKLDTEGWSKLADHDVLEVAEHFQREGVAGILYNDRDASRPPAPAFSAASTLAQAVTLPVIIAGGLSSLEDIQQLCEAGGSSLAGAVLFVKDLDFTKAQKFADTLVDKPDG